MAVRIEDFHLLKIIVYKTFGYVKELICSILAITDGKSLFDAIFSSHSIEDKKLLVNICFLREMFKNKEIQTIDWLQSE